jgi:hypothetical protein
MTTTITNAAAPEPGLTRRQLLSTAIAAGASTVPVHAAAAADLPQRGEFIVRNVHVLSGQPSNVNATASLAALKRRANWA